MTERGPIVCATDLGRTGARAVDLAARMAAATQRPLRLVHVTGPGPDIADEASLTEAERVLRERLRTRIEVSAAALENERERAEGLGPHAEAELLEGRPWEQIVEYATRSQASMVVVGPHGEKGPASFTRGGFTEWLLGTTADRVVRHAPCPVMVGPRDNSVGGPIGHSAWVVAIDFSEPSRVVLRTADELAHACEASLVLLHVEAGFDQRHDGEPMRFAEEAHARQDELAALATDVLGRPAEVRLAFGDPATVVAEAAEQLDARLVVMGTRGLTGLKHLLLGSTAERTLRRAHVPVLCIKA